MSKHSRATEIRPVNSMPATVAPNGALPVLSEPAQLDIKLSDLADALLGEGGAPRWPKPEYLQKDIVAVKEALPIWPQLRRQWAYYDRPATADHIAGEMVKLTTGTSMAGNVDPDLTTNVLCEDIAELRPTLFVLMRACRVVRGKCRFLDQVELETQIKQLSRKAARYREALSQDPELYLREVAELIERGRAEAAERTSRDEAERKRLKDSDPEMYELMNGEDGEEQGAA